MVTNLELGMLVWIVFLACMLRDVYTSSENYVRRMKLRTGDAHPYCCTQTDGTLCTDVTCKSCNCYPYNERKYP